VPEKTVAAEGTPRVLLLLEIAEDLAAVSLWWRPAVSVGLPGTFMCELFYYTGVYGDGRHTHGLQ